jgi:hypothetical protein
MSDLYRIVYYSHNRMAGDGRASGEEIRRILAVSQRNNEPQGITGALIFNAGCFGQVLEGPQNAIEETFERIQQDDRHGDVSLLDFAPISHRSFPNWSMAYAGASLKGEDDFNDIAAESGFDLSKMTGERLHEILYALTLEEEQAA